MSAPAAPDGAPPAKRAKPDAQGPLAARPEPFAGGFKCDRIGGGRDDCEDEGEPPRGAPAREIERLWGLHQAGAISLR
eukprot:8490947-Pyramimonas_sp.AAC.1